ncbi:MAG: phosphatidylserine decarboxylase [Alistipes sp.]|nr:phosphatidylserine decarboxylase [Alistipes sp.]
MIKDRSGNIIPENRRQGRALKLLYRTVPGRIILKGLTAPIVSKIVGKFMDSPLSVFMIGSFIRNNNINMDDFQPERYSSYNAFFTRRIKPDVRPVDMENTHLISPCDSKLTVYEITENSRFNIKASSYSVAELTGSRKASERYKGGLCMIFRLDVDDYHRYCYIDDGTKTVNRFIPGELHTVNPIALERYNIYKRNSRECTLLCTENFGDVMQVEVGAMMVGRICNLHSSGKIRRGEEKGRFEFGGSTIVLLFEKDKVVPDSDILANSAQGTETVVRYGESIAISAQ